MQKRMPRRFLSLIVLIAMFMTLIIGPQAIVANEESVSVLDDLSEEENTNELKVYFDQERQVVEGYILSGAFRQADHLLNGFADYPELQKEVLDLVFGLEGKGIGLSIWRNMVADQQGIANYRWNQWGRWFDGAAPTHKIAATHSETASTVDANGKSNFDGDNYRWWFDATNPPDWSSEDIPAGASGWNAPGEPLLRQIDPLHHLREGGARGNSVFDQFDWPEQPANANLAVVGRNGLAPLDRGQVWAMKIAQQYAEERGEEMKFISSVWSPPAWMKTTNSTYGSGRFSGGGVAEEDWDDFATYVADYVEGFEKIYGIPIWGLSISNEPNEFGGSYSSCYWSPAQYEQIVREYVGPEWEARGLADKTRIQIGDQSNYNTDYYRPFWNNAETNPDHYHDYIFHSYGASSISGSMVNNDNFRELKVRAQTSGKNIMESEISTMSGQNFTSWDYRTDETRTANGTNQPSTMGVGLGWGQKWMRQMGILEINATGQWWAWGFKNPEPNWPGDPADKSLENLIYIENNAQGQWGGMTTAPGNENSAMTGSVKPYYRVHKAFWALGHFSKFVRPGWIRVNNLQTPVFEEENPQFLNVMTTAYRSSTPDENGYYDIAIVTFNATRENQTFDLSFPGYTVESITPWRTIEDGTLADPARSGTARGNNMVEMSPIELNADGVTSIELVPVSMYTFVGKAKLNDGYTVDAKSVVPGYNYNNIDGYAIFNNARDLDDPRVETLLIPNDGPDQWTEDTYAAITYDNLNFGKDIHEAVDTLVLNIGGPGQGGIVEGEVPISVYVGDELVSAPGQMIETSDEMADYIIPLNDWVYGVNDLTIELGAEGSNVRTRINSLQFIAEATPPAPTPSPTEPTTKPTDPTTKPTTPTDPTTKPTTPAETTTQPTTPSAPSPTQVIGENEVAMVVDAQDGLQAVAKMQEDAFSEDVTLRIRRISNDSEEGRSAIATLNSAISGIEQLFLLDIQAITASGASVQPIDGKTVSITMPIPEGFDPARIAVAHIKPNGAVEILRATVKDGMVTFITDSFSTFAIMEIALADSVPAPGELVKTGENSTSNVYLILLGTLLIMAVGYKLYIVRKQKMAIAEGMKKLESETSDQ